MYYLTPSPAPLKKAYFGMDAQFWINLQSHYELEIARDKLGERLSEVRPYAPPV